VDNIIRFHRDLLIEFFEICRDLTDRRKHFSLFEVYLKHKRGPSISLFENTLMLLQYYKSYNYITST
jgi:hypothetical protein